MDGLGGTNQNADYSGGGVVTDRAIPTVTMAAMGLVAVLGITGARTTAAAEEGRVKTAPNPSSSTLREPGSTSPSCPRRTPTRTRAAMVTRRVPPGPAPATRCSSSTRRAATR
jgi:hypothetical protein